SDKVRRSIIMDCKADLLVFGMGERGIVEIARRLDAGQTVRDLREMRGMVYRLGAKEAHGKLSVGFDGDDAIELPTYEQVVADKRAFAEMTRTAHLETNPHNARRLVQRHGPEAIVVNPPALPL